MTPPRDRDVSDSLAQLDEAFAPPGGERRRSSDDTHEHLAAVTERVNTIVAAREKERGGKVVRNIGVIATCVALIGTLGGGIWSLGEVSAQQQQTRADVARVLVAVELLGKASATVDARLDAVTRESAGLHESIKALEQRQWEQRSRTTRPEERP